MSSTTTRRSDANVRTFLDRTDDGPAPTAYVDATPKGNVDRFLHRGDDGTPMAYLLDPPAAGGDRRR